MQRTEKGVQSYDLREESEGHPLVEEVRPPEDRKDSDSR